MSDRVWMYTGRTSQKQITNEWLTKPKGFVKATFTNGQRKHWCPCVGARTGKRGHRMKWANTYRRVVLHACEKGCALFRLEYADLNYSPICKSSRYIVVDNGMGEKTQTKIPVNVLRYMPIIPRLQRLFMVEETARQMTWHKMGKKPN